MSKKAEAASESVVLIWKLVLAAIIIVFEISVIYYYMNEKIDTDPLQMEILYMKLAYSPECLAYNDGITAKLNSNLIDFAKLDSEWLARCSIRNDYGVKITLKNMDSRDIKSASIITKEKLNLMPVCESTQDFKCYKKISFVNYVADGEKKPGILQLEVIKNAET